MRAYREYALASLADSYDLALVMPEAPTWQRQYIATSRIAETGETSSLLSAVGSLMADRADVGILTWDEFSLVSTAEVAEKLGLRHMSAASAGQFGG
jgi:hypothetical protein